MSKEYIIKDDIYLILLKYFKGDVIYLNAEILKDLNGPTLDISFCYHEQMRDDPRIIALKDYLQNLIREDLSKFSNTI